MCCYILHTVPVLYFLFEKTTVFSKFLNICYIFQLEEKQQHSVQVDTKQHTPLQPVKMEDQPNVHQEHFSAHTPAQLPVQPPVQQQHAVVWTSGLLHGQVPVLQASGQPHLQQQCAVQVRGLYFG